MKIRVGDKVQVMSGKSKDKGVQAEVQKVFPDSNRVIVKGVNIVTRHLKKTAGNPGQIIKFEKPISASSVMLICPFSEKPTRIGFVKIEEKGKQKKFRFSKRALKEKGGEAKKYIIK